MRAKQEFERIRDEYLRTRDDLTEKEKAELEKLLWSLHEERAGDRGHRHPWYTREFGGGGGAQFDDRCHLISLGDWVDPLWDEIDKNHMPLTTAIRLARSAKRRALERRVSNKTALQEVLGEYLKGFLRELPDGKWVRVPKPKAKVVREGSDKNRHPITDAKQLRATIDAIMAEYLDRQLKDVDESVKLDLLKDFTFGLRALYEDLSQAVQKQRRLMRDGSFLQAVSWNRFRNACEVLGVHVTKTKQPDLEDLRKRYRKLAAQFHPDRNNGAENMVKQYHAVNEAWECVKDYLRQEGGVS